FGKPETRNIRIVRTNTQAAANAAKAALARGQSWDAVAKKYSIDSATKNNGGAINGVTKGKEEQALDTAAFGTKVNTIVGPVHGQFGYYVVEVTKIIPGNQQSLAQATPLIKQILNGNKQTSAQTAVDAQAKKQWLSKTKCRSAYSMADCSGYKAPKTPATTAPGASTAPQSTAPQTTTSSTP
ncbi:MAG: peptidylprolyl isomerase, partial [Solirubrobacteraceae bacterium]